MTNNNLDMAVNGPGFFILQGGTGGDVYTRNGQFQMDKDGYIVSSAGHKLQGYPAGSTSVGGAGTGSLQISTADIPANPSASITAVLNLDSTSPVIASAFLPTDSTTFTNSTSTTAYDSEGNPLTTTMYFQKTAQNKWEVYATIADKAGNMIFPNPAPVVPVPGWAGSAADLGLLNFNQSGTLTPAPVLAAASFVPTSFVNALPAAVPATQSLAFDFSGATQFAGPFAVSTLSTDGNAQGTLGGFNVSADGTIVGRYSNGKTQNLGTVALATFKNMNGLQPLGDNEWVETSASGTSIKGVPGQGGKGLLQTSATEDSNVDLTAELVNMITAQRNYQANAQTIKVMDAVMQTLINMR